ncbi:hypothetical protein [Roseovarius atlanticus]|uniref:hypothetical protein n=1 Tax=Roseovarius atlanticus TaxID=1641875 RepID=UPI001C98AF87|nr:hypothetical protein [Roseovarius atlanticus]MBY5989804.1 hypothetical protein [Roseovarius atlanticus]MBY6126349.1 hypothetical protein [Roseovarius atlanticus]MBY6150843.1 hypothetical protein [Roseovarius atlanticus]
MNKRTVEVFSVIGAIATVIGVAVAVYFGYRSLSQPGLEVQGISELVDEARKGNEISGDILDAVAAKDPIEALSRRGYDWTRVDFFRALRTQDETSVALYCDAGPVNVFKGDLGLLWTTKDIPPARIATLGDCAAFDSRSVCENDDYLTASAREFDWDAYIELCGAAPAEVLRQHVAEGLEAEASEARDYCADFNAASDSMKDALSRNFMLHWMRYKTWHRFGGAHSAVEFCDGVARLAK